MSKYRKIIYGFIMTGFVLFIVFSIHNTPRVNYAAEAAICRKNLQNITLPLLDYCKKHGDIPRHAEGEPSLLPLACDSDFAEGCLNRDKLKCIKTGSDFSSFVLSPLYSPSDFDIEDDSKRTVIICHAPDFLHRRSDDAAYVLLSDGCCPSFKVEREKYRKWVTQFKKGDPGSNSLESFLSIVEEPIPPEDVL